MHVSVPAKVVGTRNPLSVTEQSRQLNSASGVLRSSVVLGNTIGSLLATGLTLPNLSTLPHSGGMKSSKA